MKRRAAPVYRAAKSPGAGARESVSTVHLWRSPIALSLVVGLGLLTIASAIVLAGSLQRAQSVQIQEWRRNVASWGAIAGHLRALSSAPESASSELAQVVALAEDDAIRPLPLDDNLALTVAGLSNNVALNLRRVGSGQTVSRDRLVRYTARMAEAYTLAAESAESRAEGRAYPGSTLVELMRALNESASGP